MCTTADSMFFRDNSARRRPHSVSSPCLGKFPLPASRQVFIWVIFHAFPRFAFPFPFSPKRLPTPFLRRVPALPRSPDFGTTYPEAGSLRCSPCRETPFGWSFCFQGVAHRWTKISLHLNDRLSHISIRSEIIPKNSLFPRSQNFGRIKPMERQT